VKYLLDTHALLWLAEDSPNVSTRVRGLFADQANEMYFSVASLWEMAVKISLKKLRLPGKLADFVESEVLGNQVKLMPVKAAHTFELEQLPFYHRDPFDRLLICQATYEGMQLISRDSAFRKYDVEPIW
jgi:PIN domain nuclease of toxin-antitoxin system